MRLVFLAHSAISNRQSFCRPARFSQYVPQASVYNGVRLRNDAVSMSLNRKGDRL
jgi:hypothetical protein